MTSVLGELVEAVVAVLIGVEVSEVRPRARRPARG